MPWLYSMVIGVLLGLVVGSIAERLPLAPLLQSVVAAYVAMTIAAIGVGLVWFMGPPQSGGLGAISVEFGNESLLFLAGLGLAFVGLHVLLGWFGASAPVVAQHRASIMGCLGGLCGALPVAWMMSVSMRSM